MAEKAPEASLQLDSSLLGMQTIAAGLDVPWEICWGPDDRIWFTEQNGSISRLDPTTGEKKLLLRIPEVWRHRSAGLLGMAVGKLIDNQVYVFVDFTHRHDSVITSRLVRYRLDGDTLVEARLLLEIPGNTGHNGSRVVLSPGGLLYWATGDAANLANAQNRASLNGKILRLHTDGSIPADNPDPQSPVWAMGFRNMQGLTFSATGRLYASEHGDATDDEINLLLPAGNYGWPLVEGFTHTDKEKQVQPAGSMPPLKAWTPTIAPAGMEYYGSDLIPEWTNSLLLGTLKDQSLRVLQLDARGEQISTEQVFLEKALGRIRDICVSPQGEVFLATSNRDWNPAPGFPKPQDDRIIRLAPDQRRAATVYSATAPGDPTTAQATTAQANPNPETIYNQYCASCHKPDGRGLPGSFPALKASPLVNGDPQALIHLLLKGKKQMPAFEFLSNQELSAIGSFIRSSWGNNQTAITEPTIQLSRNK
ncbi:quinoprotein glucose dehydrogenase [Flavihumibacter stibioxidans]|uniref:Quinoprotein glucose dehydrogenase n=2 Tax=Flavihumibacter stibioxidans TaxID=1834163 RepID=A0ABR7M8W8_9BACT|nr:quinoprotein glucose dehydrogenase [Flavihumibacter stibioxidans]